MTYKIISFVLALLVPVVFLTGCTTPETPSFEQACSAILDQSAAGTDNPFTVLVDVTASMGLLHVPTDFREASLAASLDGRDVKLIAVDGGLGRARVILNGRLSSDADPASKTRRLQAENMGECLAGRALRDGRPTQPGSDLQAALTLASEGLPEGSTLWVLTDGQTNSGAWNLTQMDPSIGAQALARSWQQSAPVRLTGVHLAMPTLGASAIPVPTYARSWLATLYRSLCEQMGATGCQQISLSTDPTQPPADSGSLPDPAVQYPGLQLRTKGEGCRAELPSAVLFGEDSAALLPEAQELLRPLARLIQSATGRTRIVGHTASGEPGMTRQAKLELSRRRARATLHALLLLGAPSSQMRATGVGSSQRLVDDLDATGHLREPQASRNRRVEILIKGATCGR